MDANKLLKLLADKLGNLEVENTALAVENENLKAKLKEANDHEQDKPKKA